MAAYKIYHKNGSILADANGKEIEVHSIEYNGTWMGECFVTATFENEAPIDFSIGDYIVYRNERFEINYDPGKIKCSSKDSYGGAFKYDSVKFNALSDELVRCDMLDLVLYDNNLHYTALPQFVFYVESIDDLLDRIQANLDELYGKATWKLYSRNKERSIQRGCTAEGWEIAYGTGTTDNVIDSTSISISDQNCWDALSLVNSQFDVNFIIRDRNVYVGTAGVPTANIFKYGKDKGLYEIEQNSESDQFIVTRLRAYGSNKNLPSSYYATLNGVPYTIAGGISETNGEDGAQLAIGIDKTKYEGSFTDVNYEAPEGIKECRVVCSIGETSFHAEVWMKQAAAGMSSNTLVITGEDVIQSVKPLIVSGQTRITFTSGANAHGFNGDRLDYSSSLPNNMACDRLMLPGFPNKSLQEWWAEQSDAKKAWLNPGGKSHLFSIETYRPYVESLNKDNIGIRPSSVFFDKEDKMNGIVEIYPTIEGMEIDGIRIDEIDTGTSVEDDGIFADTEEASIPNAVIYLKSAINFDVNELKRSDFAISMKDGMCAGRSFNIAACRKEKDGRWRLQIERRPDDSLGLYFPYRDFQIKKGDHFVLTGIELPDAYVEAASEKLLKYCIAYLDKNDYTRYVYQPKVDEIFMARQHDAAMADSTGLTKSLYMSLKEGDIMLFKDDDLGIDAEITIDQLTIKEEDGKIPTYEITLREEKEVGTIQKIQNQISSIADGNGINVTNGSSTANQIKDLTLAEARTRFLSKLSDDYAAGLITFLQGLVSNGAITANGEIFAKEGLSIGNFVASLLDGRGAGIDKGGNAEVESLRVRSYMQVMELIINRIRSMDGDLVLTEGDNIESVEEATDAEGHVSYKLHLKQQWEGYYTAQAVGNVLKGVINTLAQGSGTYYTSWMLVKDVDTATNTITVDLYPDDETPARKNFPPCDMMNIIRWGNNIDPKRQSCIYLSSTEGVIKKLIHVTKPILDEGNDGFIIGNLPEWLTKDPSVPVEEGDDAVYVKTLLYQNIHQIDYQGKRQPVYVDRGNWIENPAEPYHYEATNSVTGVYETSDVWYYGCKWRCIKDCPTDAPKWNSMQWMQIEGNPNFEIEITIENGGLLDFDYFTAHGTTLEVTGKIYNLDVTKDILDTDVTWTRYTEDPNGTPRTESDNVWNLGGHTGKTLHLTKDDLNIDSSGMPSVIKFTARALLRDGVEAEDTISVI